MVSLPSKWIKQNSLDKGSEIDIEQKDNLILISAKSIELQKKSIEIKLEGKTESIIRTYLMNIYRAGYDHISAEYESEQQYIAATKAVKTLIGMEITKKDKNHFIIESITEPSSDQFDNIMLKIFYASQEIINLTKERLNNQKITGDYDEIEQRIMRYESFCKRTLSKKIVLNEKSEFLWTFITLLHRGQREIYHMNTYLSSKQKYSKELINLLNLADKVFNLLKESYLKQNMNSLSELHEIESTPIFKKGHDIIQKHPEEAHLIIHLVASIRTYYLCTSPLSGVIL